MSVEIGLLLALGLLLANAFFVGAEFSLVSVRRSTIEPMAATGSKPALITLRALENVSLLMAGAQLGITLCSLGLGAVAEPTLAHLLEGPFHAIPLQSEFLHPISFAIALLITVFLHVVIGEMVPKNIALARPERTALLLAPKLVFVVTLLRPLIALLNLLSNGILRLAGVRARTEVVSTYTRDEMADLVKESRRGGYLSEDNEFLLSGALTFDTQTVHDIVIPLADVVSVDANATYGTIEDLSVRTGFSRFPVKNKKNKLIGYVHIKDSIQSDDQLRRKQLGKHNIRKLISIPSGQSIRMTLKVMQRSGAHVAIVCEGKTMVGLVTLNDVLEELVGEISN
ncbi:MAG: hemolysin family protein [Candidatus Saccharimonadales bacterium]